ncbi:MAG: D-glycerate dehydrogenase [Trueperaceae bacterium]|nr:D-glycerate dehydrogenase [Trueperaceae bacterium]
MPHVAITRRLPEGGLEPLRSAGYRCEVHDADEAPSRGELLALVAGADAVITLLSDRVDDAFLDAAGPQLQVVANYAVGLDNVDLDACTRRGVAVAHTPGVLTEATADLAFALLLAVARRVVEGHRLASSDRWTGWQPLQLLGTSLHGRTFGVIGLGRIGEATARRARAFGMEIVYAGRSDAPRAEDVLGARRLEIDALLGASDVVSLHCPLTDDTRHMIDGAALARMKRSAILINTARGEIVDEAALVEALQAGRLRGAGLDVFEHEPSIHPGLTDLPNAVLTPHLGSATVDVRTEMARVAADAVVAVLEGRDAPQLARRP